MRPRVGGGCGGGVIGGIGNVSVGMAAFRFSCLPCRSRLGCLPFFSLLFLCLSNSRWAKAFLSTREGGAGGIIPRASLMLIPSPDASPPCGSVIGSIFCADIPKRGRAGGSLSPVSFDPLCLCVGKPEKIGALIRFSFSFSLPFFPNAPRVLADGAFEVERIARLLSPGRGRAHSARSLEVLTSLCCRDEGFKVSAGFGGGGGTSESSIYSVSSSASTPRRSLVVMKKGRCGENEGVARRVTLYQNVRFAVWGWELFICFHFLPFVPFCKLPYRAVAQPCCRGFSTPPP
jgi:hypothetical protein